jgi:hypothetical protein
MAKPAPYDEDTILSETISTLKTAAEAAEDPQDRQKYYDLLLKAIALSRKGRKTGRGSSFTI